MAIRPYFGFNPVLIKNRCLPVMSHYHPRIRATTVRERWHVCGVLRSLTIAALKEIW
jgi:hypothetical protein